MKELELIPQEQFRQWFKEHFPLQDLKLTKLFEDFTYDGQHYLPKRLESKKETRTEPRTTDQTSIRKSPKR